MKMKSYICLEKGSNENEKIRILLVYPKTGADAPGFSLHMPLSLLYLCTQLKDFSVAIFDQRVDDMSVFERLLEDKPLCVGLSTMTGKQIENALFLAENVKNKNIPTIFGGVHPTLLPEQTLEDSRVDYVISGEGELAFREIIEKLKDGTEPETITYGKTIDMDKLNLMEVFDLVDVEKYISNHMLEGRCLPFQFSRGCPFQCTFCCNTVLNNSKWRRQSLEVAIPIINKMVEKYKLNSVWFVDENLTVNKEVIYGLAKSINARFDWYIQARSNSFLNLDVGFLNDMGLKSVGIGLESGSDFILENIKKQQNIKQYIDANNKLSETYIKVWYNYMMGYPDEKMEDLKKTIELALRIMDDNPNAYNNTFYLLTPYPETEIANKYFKDVMPMKLVDWISFGRHNFEASWHNPEMLKVYERISISSKFVGKKFLKMFPCNEELIAYVNELTHKWRTFDFFNDIEWEKINQKGFKLLNELFGENAY